MIRELAHLAFASRQISRFLDEPDEMNLSKPVSPPDGSPIGMGDFDFCGFHAEL